ncbi:hypothetical protein OESDEN_17390, partial [Oesophagostomum dentatum]
MAITSATLNVKYSGSLRILCLLILALFHNTLISGFHSAITISIAAYNYKAPPAGFGVGTWFRNTEMFAGRFGTKWSWEGPQRLKNVYFVFLLELRAL